MNKNTALKLVLDELDRAQKQHKPMSSCHEGYAVIKEEFDELWKEIMADRGSTHRGTSEAVQVAAMALRYLVDLCGEPTAKQHDTKVETHFASTSSYGGYSG